MAHFEHLVQIDPFEAVPVFFRGIGYEREVVRAGDGGATVNDGEARVARAH